MLFASLFPRGVRYFRWGRLVRVLKLRIVSKRTWHSVTAVLQSHSYIYDVTLLFCFAIIVYALIGQQVLAEALGDPSFTLDMEANFSFVEDAIVTLSPRLVTAIARKERTRPSTRARYIY